MGKISQNTHAIGVTMIDEFRWQPQLQAFLQKYLADPKRLLEFLSTSGRVGFEECYDGKIIFEKGTAPVEFAIILEGSVDVVNESGVRFKGRSAGELIGEQAFLFASQPGGREACRTATIKAHGSAKLVKFHGDIIAGMNTEILACWYELMAHVLNEKLAEASDERSRMVDENIAKLRLLERFCDKEALSLVSTALEGGMAQTPNRDTVIWFSDIAGFSGWSKGRPPEEVAATANQLLGLQAKLIHESGGGIDKFMGDGLMAFWFVDKMQPETVLASILCAKAVVERFNQEVSGTEMAGLTLRVGLHCGDVCFGDFGTNERIAVTLIGEAVNLAARYEQIRSDDQIPDLGAVRISPELYDRVAEIDGDLVAEIKGPKPAGVKLDKFDVYWIEVT